ncbi:hypothetical protein DXG03_002908 [Asterophora parasitica]|uniref:GTP-binding protein rhb1 n=1 Tax=Asterophora parasitica TaxID=117018 RepID=A0A9P7KEN3_9AGAR|nr:hypothetical protein DXG03_002908 [Asterophora parasitica]
MASHDALKKRKIAVLGSRSVGKSSMIVQFVERQFIESYYPTIESTFTKSVSLNGTTYDCKIIDTAGQDEYSLLGPNHAIGIHGFVLVYSVASRKSFDMIKVIYDKIINFCGVADIPCVIVGAKMDLNNSRQVEAAEGEALAKKLHATWVETSAKNNVNVAKVFDLCLIEIEKQVPPSMPEPAKPSSCIVM